MHWLRCGLVAEVNPLNCFLKDVMVSAVRFLLNENSVAIFLLSSFLLKPKILAFFHGKQIRSLYLQFIYNIFSSVGSVLTCFWLSLFRKSSVPSCSSGQDSVALILEVIKSAIRFQKTISEAWLKVSWEFIWFSLPFCFQTLGAIFPFNWSDLNTDNIFDFQAIENVDESEDHKVWLISIKMFLCDSHRHISHLNIQIHE